MIVNKRESYDYLVAASGRVNLIGEHVDYCGGKVFPAAISLKNRVYLRPNGTDVIRLMWRDSSNEVVLEIGRLGEYGSLKYANYIAGSFYEWQKRGHAIVGADMLFDCDIPFGSGLSSSAAIEVSAIAAMCALTGEILDKPQIALAAQSAEREYVGVNCGIMDQYASACGVKGHAMLLDCESLSCEQIPVDFGDYSLAIANCNKPHSLKESKYNERRAETERAFALLKEVLSVNTLAEIGTEDFYRYGSILPRKLYDRTKHVVEECARVEVAAKAMKEGNILALGRLFNASHASLRDLYEVTGAELDALWEAALASPGCVGSRMTGAGFGGCTISLVRTEKREMFAKSLEEIYKEKIGYAPSVYWTEISDGITINKL